MHSLTVRYVKVWVFHTYFKAMWKRVATYVDTAQTYMYIQVRILKRIYAVMGSIVSGPQFLGVFGNRSTIFSALAKTFSFAKNNVAEYAKRPQIPSQRKKIIMYAKSRYDLLYANYPSNILFIILDVLTKHYFICDHLSRTHSWKVNVFSRADEKTRWNK